MREIKYQAYDPANAKMLDWNTIKSHLIMPGNSGWNWREYTGLKDKQGKEIFEGDIVIGFPTGNHPAFVDFVHGAFMIYMKSKGEWFWLYNPPYEWKVIGNIYENPELLGVK